MYTLTVRRDFVAQHYLIGGDWGPENSPHSHHYRLELTLRGDTLDQHGYLVDIVEVEEALDAAVATYRDKTLNDMPGFEGLNPSIERFCYVLATHFNEVIGTSNISGLEVTLWENRIASASYTLVP